MKNALQAQLLKAGLVNENAVKKANKQQHHAQRTGQADNQVKQDVAKAIAEKQAKDQALNLQQQAALLDKAKNAAVRQMLTDHHIHPITGDVGYQFVDAGKIKKLYITQDLYNQLVRGQVAIARFDDAYRLIPSVFADKIASHAPALIVVKNDKAALTQASTPDEDDPYAAYVIPDDLMW